MTQPPFSLKLERALLAGVMHDPDSGYRTASQFVRPEDFHQTVHASLFSLMGRLHGRGRCPDFATVLETLTSSGNLEKAGGVEELAGLLSEAQSGQQVAAHAQRIAELSLLRQTLDACGETAKLCCDGESEAAAVLEGLRQTTLNLSSRLVGGVTGNHVSDILNLSFADIEERSTGIETMEEQGHDEDRIRQAINPGIQTGFYTLDRKTSGIKPGEVWTVAAVTGGGKSSWAQTLAHYTATKRRLPVVYFTLEMTKREVTNRLLSIGTKHYAHGGLTAISTKELEYPKLTPDQWQRLGDARRVLASSPITIIDDATTIDRIRHRLQRLMLTSQERPLVVIDHLHLIDKDVRRGANDATAAEEMANKIKRDIALGLGVPVLQLAQFNQDVYTTVPTKAGQPPKREEPQLRHLYGGSGIQKASDVIVFICYPDGFWPDQAGWDNDDSPTVPCEFVLKKNRSGGLGRTPAGFLKAGTTFVNAAAPDPQPHITRNRREE